ncbi:AAA family ATPase [Wenzhouxiangella sp. AB-CW3]|uniref:ExeA family protein n=1 Tax=Wenzhouxiangella sp. AB-CW3 TaxID=2771012 RepID=UPI00168A7A8E|nr:AAA family ATPase [Wenzhouxiangella sp. AB-CW3]QOC24021.1 AAA family ATPase [Wenzhouxiangella sp. AB-CW3]
MYEQYFGLSERPFSITPNPRFVYLSQRHRDALAHLLYGVGQGGSGGFVQLTGEVGTGKTTLCRVVLEQIPDNTQIALILNPMLSPAELLRAICGELEIDLADSDGSLQSIQDHLNRFLLDRHAAGQKVVLIIDEAQNMNREALEQIRLLTNLETATDKLLQIILIGQPELRELLARAELRQLAQRITARFHLDPLNRDETEHYIRYRLEVAGAEHCPFTDKALRAIFEASEGIPRLVNIIADRSLMAGYAREQERVGAGLVWAAAREVAGEEPEPSGGWLRGTVAALSVGLILAAGGALGWAIMHEREPDAGQSMAAWQNMLAGLGPDSAWAEMATVWPRVNRAEIVEACTARDSNQAGLACLTLRGSWNYVVSIGLPVILSLEQPHSARVLMVGMDGDHVVLRYHGQDYRVPVRQLDRRWLGDFYVVWPDDGGLLRLGDSGSEVERMKRLAEEVGEPEWTGGTGDQYDEAFRQWVEAFQRRHGLADDGVIGPATRLFLKAPHDDAPALQTDFNGG